MLTFASSRGRNRSRPCHLLGLPEEGFHPDLPLQLEEDDGVAAWLAPGGVAVPHEVAHEGEIHLCLQRVVEVVGGHELVECYGGEPGKGVLFGPQRGVPPHPGQWRGWRSDATGSACDLTPSVARSRGGGRAPAAMAHLPAWMRKASRCATSVTTSTPASTAAPTRCSTWPTRC